MTDTQASEAARSLANTRWAGQVVTRALETLASRSDELTDEQRDAVRAIADGEPRG